MKVNVMIFGQLTEVTAGNQITVENVDDTSSLIAEMCRIYPKLAHYHYLVAVNREVVHENTPLTSNSTIALLPPFSGG